MDDKKTKEIVILSLFRESYPDFPKGVLNPAESPDFILSITPRKKIGIELTRLNQRVPDSDLCSFENISACLLSKNEKLVLYKRKRLQEYWLILFIERPAKIRFNLNNKLIMWVFESGFNKVFLLNETGRKIYELNTG